MIQGNSCTLFRVAVLPENVPADNAQSMCNHGNHVAVFLNIFRKSVAHQAPSPDISHPGDVSEEIITHFVLLFFKHSYYNSCVLSLQVLKCVFVVKC